MRIFRKTKIFDVAIFTFLMIQHWTLHHCACELIIKSRGFHNGTNQNYSPLLTRELNFQFLFEEPQCQHSLGWRKEAVERAHVRAADRTSDWESEGM